MEYSQKIDELIQLAEKSSESAKGGNKKCFLEGDYALLYGHINEQDMKTLIHLTKDLKTRGVNVARTFDYRITDGTKGYSLQERATGDALHNRVKWDVPEEELPMQKQIYTDRLKTLTGENQAFYDKFVHDWLEIQKAGIRIDPSKMDNFYYEPGKGITFIDLDAGVGKVDEQGVPLKTVCVEIATILAGSNKYFSFGRDEEVSKTANKELSHIFKKFAKSMEKAGLSIRDVKAILKDRYPDVDLTEPMKQYQDPAAKGKVEEEFAESKRSSFREKVDSSVEERKFNSQSFRESLQSATVKTSEVKRIEQEISERNEYRRLSFQKSKGFTAEQQARYDMLYAKYYMTPGEKKQQSQKKGMSMGM